jgi:xanthine dehydrogenase YagT iron-sulfur-binding subunit
MRLRVNGVWEEVAVAAGESLLATIRERLALRGTKEGCDRGECGACTVLVNGAPVYACLTLTESLDGCDVRTIEGVAGRTDGGLALHAVQRAFIACDAVQCGYCTPGQIMSAVALLERDPDPTDAAIAEAMSGNLCRCGTYPKIVQAVRRAVRDVPATGAAP